MPEKKTKGICGFCGKPICLSRYDEQTNKERWLHYAAADGKQAGHIAKLKQS
jgi:hypothetical protein